jgi:hypothetical protein
MNAIRQIAGEIRYKTTPQQGDWMIADVHPHRPSLERVR